MIENQEILYTIQEASEKLNIPKSTLRYWEKELDAFISPVRTNGGQRRYQVEDLMIINRVRQLRASGMGMPEIKSKLKKEHRSPRHNIDVQQIDFLAKRLEQVIRKEIHRFFFNPDKAF